jgi:hypothetical protein
MATLNSSNIVNGNTIETNDILQLYNAFTSNGGYSVSISGSLTGSATSASVAISASFAISSSRAISSSFSATSSFVAQVNNQQFIDSSTPSTILSGSVKFIAGGGSLNNGIFTSTAYTPLVGKIMGRTLWVNASYTGTPDPILATNPTLIVNVTNEGQIQITQVNGSDDAPIVWTGIYT